MLSRSDLRPIISSFHTTRRFVMAIVLYDLFVSHPAHSGRSGTSGIVRDVKSEQSADTYVRATLNTRLVDRLQA